MVSLLRGCLEKNRDLRWQRMHPVLIELKLANTSARQSHMASDWREKVVSLRSQVEDQDQRLAAQQALQESMADELRQSIRRIEDSLAEIQESIAGLQKSSQLHTQAEASKGVWGMSWHQKAKGRGRLRKARGSCQTNFDPGIPEQEPEVVNMEANITGLRGMFCSTQHFGCICGADWLSGQFKQKRIYQLLQWVHSKCAFIPIKFT
jgi:hypothetical protein